MFGLKCILRCIISYIYHLCVSETKCFSFMTSVDDEYFLYAYMRYAL